HRDGQMRTDGNLGSTLHYHPNSYEEWQDNTHVKETPLDLFGAARHWSYSEDEDNYYEQPGKLFRLMDDEAKERLFGNTARNFDGAEEFIKIRHITNCYKADPAYGEGVAKAAGIDMDKVMKALEEN